MQRVSERPDIASQATAIAGIGAIGGVIADRYELRGILGEGGMGTVYLALDRELDEEIALKILRPEMAATPDALVRFRREVKLARRVTHPNVARTYDLGEHEGVRFLTMERIDGHSLRDAKDLSLPEILRVAWEITQGLAAAHAVGVVHRDLKPDNIMLTGERVVLTDFGIARSEDPGGSLRTSGSVVGTPAYIAPEQLEGAAVDGRTDVYALGAMLYELVVGQLPFVGETAAAVAIARLTRAPAPIHAVKSGVPDGVAQLVMSALARRKEDRPDAHTVASRLARLRGVGHDSETRVRATSSADVTLPSAHRTVRIGAVETDDASRALGADLARAMSDALSTEPTLRLAPEGASAEETIDATVRTAADRVRVRLRLLSTRGDTLWADKLEGTLSDPFGLEDAVAERILKALRARAGSALGPGGALQERFEKARALVAGGPESVRAAIAMLEEVDRESPDNAWIMSLLSCALSTLAAQMGAVDETLFGRAEEIALRAIDRDPSNGLAYYATAFIRMMRGDHPGSLAAAHEALRRLPRLADAHHLVGRALCASGRVAEGLQRIDLTTRLDPRIIDSIDEKIRVLALMGERESARRELARVEQVAPRAGILARLRLYAWWEDRELARETYEKIASMKSGAAWESAMPALQAYADGDLPTMLQRIRMVMPVLTSPRVLPRHRAFMHEIGAEYMLLCGDEEGAMEKVVAVAAMPNFINLLWLDRCPNLAPLRKRGAFAETRARVAQRVAQLLD